MVDFQKQLTSGTKIQEYSLADVLKLVSYGSELRAAFEKLAKSNRGAIVVLSEKAMSVSEGGFKINSSFTAQKLAELAKMDGAIIVDSKLRRILYANTMLTPNSRIKSKETGTKHKAGERTAKQLKVIVIVVSEKSSIISVYYGDNKYILNELTELQYKVRESIENIEMESSEIESSLKKFDSLEISSNVNIDDLAQIINKFILFFKDCETSSIYTSELGRYGETFKTRYNIVIGGVKDEFLNLERDYNEYFHMERVIDSIKRLKTPTIDQSVKILQLNVKNGMLKDKFTPLGYRVLSKLQINKDAIKKIIDEYINLSLIISADVKEISEVGGIDQEKARGIKDFLLSRVVII
ncbi:MAG TPA: DNA integrity scanning diadenylate cyclase DisA, partial [Candidatus Nanoarchaeia archaeon]|nr:DNA integrity scanning diadenylate cyclase DisA [Candidatus Nanoarchaeia archaeon]